LKYLPKAGVGNSGSLLHLGGMIRRLFIPPLDPNSLSDVEFPEGCLLHRNLELEGVKWQFGNLVWFQQDVLFKLFMQIVDFDVAWEMKFPDEIPL